MSNVNGQNWTDSLAFFQDVVYQLLSFSTGKTIIIVEV